MVFSSMSNYNLNPTSNCWNHQQVNHQQLGSSSTEVHHPRPPYIPLPPPPPPSQQPPTTIFHQGIIRPGSMTDRARMANMPIPETVLKCPRCASMNTKFCYYNNYSLSQPRYFCKNCRRYWTQGGALRNVPVGGGCRRNKRSNSKGGGGGSSSSTRKSKSPARSGSTPSNSSGCSSGQRIRPPVSFMAPLNHLSDYSIADIGANYPGLVPHQMSSSAAEHFNLLQGNVSNYTTSNSGMDPWSRFINQQQLVQQYHDHPTSFFDENLEVPPRGSTPNLYAGLESSHVTITASESNKHKLLSPTENTAASSADAQMDMLKLERNINICDTAGISSRGQLMSRPGNYQHRSFSGLFQGENAQIPQLNWIGAFENRNINNSNYSNSSTAPTIAWTDLISGFSSSSSTTLRPS